MPACGPGTAPESRRYEKITSKIKKGGLGPEKKKKNENGPKMANYVFLGYFFVFLGGKFGPEQKKNIQPPPPPIPPQTPSRPPRPLAPSPQAGDPPLPRGIFIKKKNDTPPPPVAPYSPFPSPEPKKNKKNIRNAHQVFFRIFGAQFGVGDLVLFVFFVLSDFRDSGLLWVA